MTSEPKLSEERRHHPLIACASDRAELGSKHSVHPMLIAKWKKRAVEQLAQVFCQADPEREQAQQQSLLDSLYRQIGKLQVELDFLRQKVHL